MVKKQFFAGFVLREDTTVCGHHAYKTQVDGLLVLPGQGIPSLPKVASKHLNPMNELFTAIGHPFVLNQVRNFTCYQEGVELRV